MLILCRLVLRRENIVSFYLTYNGKTVYIMLRIDRSKYAVIGRLIRRYLLFVFFLCGLVIGYVKLVHCVLLYCEFSCNILSKRSTNIQPRTPLSHNNTL